MHRFILTDEWTSLMALLVAPFCLVAIIIIRVSVLVASRVRAGVARDFIIACGAALILAPTHTAGSNGQTWSVSLYDIVCSAFGADPVYAFYALRNAAVFVVPLTLVTWLAGHRRTLTSPASAAGPASPELLATKPRL